MSFKNKSSKQDRFKKGKMEFIWSIYNFNICKSPQLFYNSDEYRKIKNRKKGNKK